MAILRNRTLRVLLFVVGCLSVMAGIIGVFLPLIPTTPFILLAAWCFVKSSTRAHEWLCRQPVLGEALVNWEKHRAISRPTKALAVATLLISGVLMWGKIANIWVKGTLTMLLLSVAIFIIKQNEKKTD